MMTVEALIRDNQSGMCHRQDLYVAGVQPVADGVGKINLADMPMTLEYVGRTVTKGWGRLDDDSALEFRAESGLTAIITTSEAVRIGCNVE